MILTIGIQSVTFGVGLFKLWSDIQIKLREIDVRLRAVEKQDDEIYSKFDKVMDKLNAIEIKLENKANRDSL
jgi:ribosome-associated translation inhibitor RaiA